MAAAGRPLRTALAVLTLALLVTPVLRAEDDAAPAADTPTFRALLTGCTEYPKLKERVHPGLYAARVRLDGSVRDVELLEKTLEEVLQVPAEDIVTLAGWPDDERHRPTRANILGALDHLAAISKPGDRVLVHFSGHGHLMPDQPPLDELDGMDEILLPADVDCPPREGYQGAIRDDEMGEKLMAIRASGAQVWLVLDACHSGTGVRSGSEEPIKTRSLDPAEIGLAPERSATRGVPSMAAATAAAEEEPDGLEGIVAFYAAQSHQEVPEVYLPDRKAPNRKCVGLLTSSVVRALELAGTSLTFGELYELVYAGYRERNLQGRVQPLAEGDLDLMVSGGRAVGGRPLVLRRTGDDAWRVSGGTLHGVVPGTTFAVYAPGKRGVEDAYLTSGVVTEVELADAACRPRKDAWPEALATGSGPWPIEVIGVPMGDRSLRVAVVGPDDEAFVPADIPEAVREVLRQHAGRFAITAERLDEAWILHLDESGGPVRLTAPGGGGNAADFRVDAATLEECLVRVYRGANLLKLAQPHIAAALPADIRLEVLRKKTDGSTVPVGPGSRLLPGEEIQLRLHLEDRSARDLDAPDAYDVWVFWIDPHLGIWQQWPLRRGESPRVTYEDEGVVDLGSSILSDESMGPENLLVVAMPQRKDDPELDLSFLAQPPLTATRGGPPVGAESLVTHALFELSIGSNTRAPLQMPVGEEGPAVRTFTWTTAWPHVRPPAGTADDVIVDATFPVPPLPAAGLPAEIEVPGPVPAPARLCRAGDAGAYCVLAAESEKEVHLLVDLDGGLGPTRPAPEAMAKAVADATFRPEIQVRTDAERRTVAYDADHDGRFDLIVVDEDGDGRAERRWRLEGEAWKEVPAYGLPLLTTAHLDYLAGRGQGRRRLEAMRRLQTIAGR